MSSHDDPQKKHEVSLFQNHSFGISSWPQKKLDESRVKFARFTRQTLCMTRVQERKVVSVSGDGGFGQYLAKVNTAVKDGMHTTHILLKKKELGKISKEQGSGNW